MARTPKQRILQAEYLVENTSEKLHALLPKRGFDTSIAVSSLFPYSSSSIVRYPSPDGVHLQEPDWKHQEELILNDLPNRLECLIGLLSGYSDREDGRYPYEICGEVSELRAMEIIQNSPKLQSEWEEMEREFKNQQQNFISHGQRMGSVDHAYHQKKVRNFYSQVIQDDFNSYRAKANIQNDESLHEAINQLQHLKVKLRKIWPNEFKRRPLSNSTKGQLPTCYRS